MVTSFVSGMLVGAIIALFCYIAGYFHGEKHALDSADNENVFVGKKADEWNNTTVSFVDPFVQKDSSADEIYEKQHLKLVKDELEQRKKASNLFRTKKGLLSYKKFVRE